MPHRILVSRRCAAELAGRTERSINRLVQRGKLVEADAFDGTAVRKGVAFEDLADYFGWSPATRDDILLGHDVDPDGDSLHYLTARNEK